MVVVRLELHERVVDVDVAAPPAVQSPAVKVGHALSRIEFAPKKLLSFFKKLFFLFQYNLLVTTV